MSVRTAADTGDNAGALTPSRGPPLSLSEVEARSVYYLQRLSDAVEQEMLERLSLVQRHHVAYTRIADHFITLLQQAADENDTRLMQLFPEDSCEDSGTASPASRRGGSPAPSPRGHASRSQRAAHVDPDVVELVSESCAKRQRAIARKLQHDLYEQRQLSSYHLAQEHQRAVASLRRQAQLQAAKEANRNRTRHHRGKESVVVERQAEEARLRAAANVRAAEVDAKQERLRQQRAAAVAAVRSMDMYTRQAVAQQRREAVLAAQDEQRALRAALKFERADHCHSERLLKTYQNEADFVDRLARKEYRERMAELQKETRKQEHDESVGLQRSYQAHVRQEPSWVTPVEAARQRALALHACSHITKTRARGTKPINEDRYTRLCGSHVVLHTKECPSREHAEIVRKLSPNHLACIQHVGPSTFWATVSAMHTDDVAVRGPAHVSWR
jgi:hypothetical protein